MDVIDHLVEEHRKVDALITRLAASSVGEERERQLRELEAALQTHMIVEETFVYPLVNLCIHSDTYEGARNEHELARGELFQARTLVSAPGFVAALEALQAGLRHHIEEEEQRIFPLLRDRAAIQLADLGDAEELEASVTDRALQTGVDEGESSSDMTPSELRAAIERFEASRHAGGSR
jgi:iron-sulfur cluster repair protein YtfE (RIC family)